MSLNNWYDKGLQPKEYMELLDEHRENFFKIYNNYTLSSDDAFFQSLKEKQLRVVVLAEVWCGHCMLDIPILLRLAEEVNMPVRFLPRDENLDLMEKYLTNGNRTVPIFIFIDKDGNEVTKWGPIASKVKEHISEQRDKLPPKESDEFEKEFQKFIAFTSKEFSENTYLWDAVYESIKDVL